ncbi:hypothetical protein KO481_25660 [Nocardia sp. NEAU-G5]|uniref:NADH-ubiquinone oxidoreductase 51kDa subunit FMN-binding domain-containing protein n=1 Tax=Nocardia albiluteola TaxID=2842303 RepID=A0ABS6B6U7_9NOCA|nr:hypothetical protein [Nocardia albiluteola]MBU3064904.1 hypothetical protein [Nocardia albiluteola]
MTTQLSGAPAGVRRLLGAENPSLPAHLDCYGPQLPQRDSGELISAVAAAGLRGRGGAGFPVARKLAAAAVGARECHLYAPAPLLEPIRRALGERRAAGYDTRHVEITAAADGFLAGEKTAVVNRLAGRAPIPSDRTGSASEAGLRGRPTLVRVCRIGLWWSLIRLERGSGSGSPC